MVLVGTRQQLAISSHVQAEGAQPMLFALVIVAVVNLSPVSAMATHTAFDSSTIVGPGRCTIATAAPPHRHRLEVVEAFVLILATILAVTEGPTVVGALFDLSNIDLNEVAVSSEDLDRIIPHRGDMRQLHHIIWTNPDCSEAVGVKYVHNEEFWVAGHIPGRPMYPGSLMIEAAAQVCSVQFTLRSSVQRFIGFLRCDEIILREQVTPGDTLLLLGKELDRGQRRFTAACQGIVTDRIVFEGKITGIVM